MFVNTFIARPILASVCSLVIILAGVVAIPTMPVAQYPALAPPQISVNAVYTGANAQEVETAVTTPLEQAINGVEGMLYMSSSSTNSGFASINVTFDITRDQDLAQVDVQNRVSQALGRLPTEVRALGVTVNKQNTGFVLGGRRLRREGRVRLALPQQLHRRLRQGCAQARAGVADVTIFGERKYSMRLWLDPLRLAARQITAGDVTSALREQNIQVAAGALGQQPAPPGQMYQFSVRVEGRLPEAPDFDNIIVKAGARRIAGPAEGRRPRRARRRNVLRRNCGSRARKRSASASSSCRPPTRWTSPATCGPSSSASSATSRPACKYQIALDTTEVVERLDPRSAEDARRSDRPRRHRDLRVPADVAEHDHPDADDPGLAHRHVRVHQVDGLLHQHADALRHHPRHRHRRRRRDRGHREHRAAHPGVPRLGAQGRGRTRWAKCSARSSRRRWC